MNEMNTHGHTTAKQLRRTREGRIVAGVCSGAAEFIGVDANILRLALAVATFFGGLGVGVYAVAWLLVPEEGKRQSIVQDLINKQKSDSGSAWNQASAYWQKQTESSYPNGTPYPGQAPYTGATAYPGQAPYTPQDAPASYPGTAPAAGGQAPYSDPQAPVDKPQSPVDEPPAKA
ncbi:PspC domain-containing protein [Sphaerisporangium fuscum]|uniref:PspC domain-containing protein n=1 Tax=Sphaerisporangium fuscum TaxID=2835868 RepID=UPI002029A0D1|nr:PspC domain-containing protein [Sphaerisporangium fuscum]